MFVLSGFFCLFVLCLCVICFVTFSVCFPRIYKLRCKTFYYWYFFKCEKLHLNLYIHIYICLLREGEVQRDY